MVNGFGGMGGGGGKGNDAGTMVPFSESMSPVGGRGGGGGGGGIDKSASSGSDCDEDATPLDEAADNGILGPAV